MNVTRRRALVAVLALVLGLRVAASVADGRRRRQVWADFWARS